MRQTINKFRRDSHYSYVTLMLIRHAKQPTIITLTNASDDNSISKRDFSPMLRESNQQAGARLERPSERRNASEKIVPAGSVSVQKVTEENLPRLPC